MNPIANNLTGNGAEIFSAQAGLMLCFKRQIRPIDKNTLQKLKAVAAPRMHAYRAMAGDNEIAQLKQCARCLFSKLDGKADIDENGNLNPEVVDCPKRGRCKWEGIGCFPTIRPSLSPAQKRVAEIADLPTKSIADKLFLSHYTVKRHMQDIKRITGAKNIQELIKILHNGSDKND